MAGALVADEYWFPWYPGHYERDAGHLDHVADSCYRRLIDAYMRGGEPIPRDPVRLMFITRTTPQQFQSVWPQLQQFFTEIDGFLHLKRCNVELDRQDARRRFASEAGKKSAAKRAQQFRLLLNDRSTTVQRPLIGTHKDNNPQNNNINNLPTTVERPFNEPRNDRTGQDIREEHKNDAKASPGPSARQQLFGACLTWLAALNGKDPNKYRGTIGQWLRDHGEIRTLQAFVEAQKNDPQGDRVAYMQRLLTPKAKRGPQI